MKCLSKDPAHRYSTAAALADDLDRFLDSRPILARPPSSAERLAKWIKRQPATAASLGVALLAACALFLGGLVYQGLLRSALKQARENELLARDQQRESDARYRLARETLSKMLEHFQNRDLRQDPRLKELQRQQLTDALGFYREVIRDRANPNAVVRFNSALASLHAGQAQFLLGRYNEGRDQVSLAVSLLEHLVKEDPANAEYRLTLAQSYRYRSYSNPGESTSSVPGSSEPDRFLNLEKARELLNALIDRDPENRNYRKELALTYNTLGSYWSGRKRLDMAEKAFRNAVEWYRRALERSPSSSTDEPGLRAKMAESLLSLAVILQQTDHKDEVLPLYAESRKVIEDALRQDPTWDEAKVSLGWTLLNWDVCLTYNPAARPKAESLIHEAIGVFTPIVNHEPDWDLARRGLPNSLGALAQMRMEQRRFGEAVRLHEERLMICAPDQKEHLQFFLAMALAKANEHQKAWSLIQTLRPGLSRRPADYHVHLATVCSGCIKAAENDSALSTADRAKICSVYGSAGVELLREALSITPESNRDELLRTQCEEPDMAPLRRQTGFPSILAGSVAAKNANPPAVRARVGNK